MGMESDRSLPGQGLNRQLGRRRPIGWASPAPWLAPSEVVPRGLCGFVIVEIKGSGELWCCGVRGIRAWLFHQRLPVSGASRKPEVIHWVAPRSPSAPHALPIAFHRAPRGRLAVI